MHGGFYFNCACVAQLYASCYKFILAMSLPKRRSDLRHINPVANSRMANREDILDLVIRGDAVFISPACLFKQNWRVFEKQIFLREIPIAEINKEAEIYGFHLNEISRNEQLFWDFMVEGFKNLKIKL